MQPIQTGNPTLGKTTENPSGNLDQALMQSSTEPTNIELPVNPQPRELKTPEENHEKSQIAAGMTQTTQKNVAIQDRHIKSNDMIEVLERDSDPM